MQHVSLGRFLWRVMVLAFVWWIISNGAIDGWLVGLPAILLAAYVSVKLDDRSTQRIRWFSLLKFIPYFLFQSFRGGLDVARRAYHRDLPLAPTILYYSLRLPPGTAQIFFSNSITLLPGTLSTGMTDRGLRIHLLEHTSATLDSLDHLERMVAHIFGIELGTRHYRYKE